MRPSEQIYSCAQELVRERINQRYPNRTGDIPREVALELMSHALDDALIDYLDIEHERREAFEVEVRRHLGIEK